MTDTPKTDEQTKPAEAPLEELMADAGSEGQGAGASTSPKSATKVLRARGATDSGRTRFDRALQLLLITNLVLIAVILILPTSGNESPTDTPAAKTAHDEVTSELRKPREPAFGSEPRTNSSVPTNQLWEAALMASRQGDYSTAVKHLETYLDTETLNDVERRLVYNQMSFYLLRDGRVSEATDYELRAKQLTERSYLPEDLIHSAERAMELGQLSDMRAAYARFLLQQKQVPPSMRKHIAEAYLKLGDSYRLEAEQGEARAPSTPRPTAASPEKDH